MTRAASALAFASVLLVAGCAAQQHECAPRLGLCAVTDDGWILQAAATGNSTRWALLVHGLNEDHHSYDAFAADLVAAGWRVVALDSRGHGESTLRADGSTRALQQFGAADFLAMEKDIDAIETREGSRPGLAVGASVGANEVLREATRLDPHVAVIALSPGLDYRGIQPAGAIAAHAGRALFMASDDDAYATSSARSLAAQHASPREVKIWSGKGHGTNLLDNETRLFLVEWATNATASN